MKYRSAWVERVQQAWRMRSVVWLHGVRRSGKTVLCRSLPDVEYFDCELPRVRQQMVDPEGFLSGVRGRRVVLDEVQRLPNPSGLLKIAADHYPDVRVIATGSSTLQSSAKFRDTLTGRKVDIWLTPMTQRDLVDFGDTDLVHRLRSGGLPPYFLEPDPPEREFEAWLDSFWAKDVQELFRLERRSGFRQFVELLLAQSGGIFEATRFAAPCEINRSTVTNYLEVLSATAVAHVVRPFSRHGSTEIISAPKVYGFDTGFVCVYRGWRPLRREDLGCLWEHLVLNELHAQLQRPGVMYWRDKRGHEVDFVLPSRGNPVTALECKWSSSDVTLDGLASFRRRYPEGENWLVADDVDREHTRTVSGLPLHVMGLPHLAARLYPDVGSDGPPHPVNPNASVDS